MTVPKRPSRRATTPNCRANARYAAIAGTAAPHASAPTVEIAACSAAATHTTVAASRSGGVTPAPVARFLLHPSTSEPRPSGYMRYEIRSPPSSARTGTPGSGGDAGEGEILGDLRPHGGVAADALVHVATHRDGGAERDRPAPPEVAGRAAGPGAEHADDRRPGRQVLVGVLDAVGGVGGDQLASGGGRRQGVHGARARDGVGIEEHQDLAGGLGGPSVAGPGLAGPPRRRVDPDDARTRRRGELGGGVGGAVVDDEHLVRSRVEGAQGVQQVRQPCLLVPRRHDDAHGRRAAAGDGSAEPVPATGEQPPRAPPGDEQSHGADAHGD